MLLEPQLLLEPDKTKGKVANLSVTLADISMCYNDGLDSQSWNELLEMSVSSHCMIVLL